MGRHWYKPGTRLDAFARPSRRVQRRGAPRAKRASIRPANADRQRQGGVTSTVAGLEVRVGLLAVAPGLRPHRVDEVEKGVAVPVSAVRISEGRGWTA